MELGIDTETLQLLQEKQPELYKQIVAQLNTLDQQSGPAATLIPLPAEFPLTDLEQYMPGRRRMRGTMRTSNIKHFVTFCGVTAERAREDGIKCFIDTGSMSATTIFNLGTTEKPGHADLTATLKLDKTAAFADLLASAGPTAGSRDQKTIAEFLEDWLPNLTAMLPGNEEQPMNRAIMAVRQIDIKAIRNVGSAVENLSQSKEIFEKVSAESQHTLPSEFTFQCTPYQGLGPRTFRLRLSVITTNDRISMKLSIRNYEAAVQEMADEFAAIVEDQIKTIPVYVGTFDKGK